MTFVADGAEYVATPRAAELIGASPSTLETLRVRGDGPRFVKRGRFVRYAIADLRSWMDEAKVASTSQAG